MTLYNDLKKASSEEDVKDLYIKALGLKSFKKGLIDIRTKEVWFEAKQSGKYSAYQMFTQLLHYVQDALDKGEPIPGLLAVIDTEKAAIMKTSDVLPLLSRKKIKWGTSASSYTVEALEAVSAYIGVHFVAFKMATDEAEFISTVKDAIKSGDIIRTQITPANLKQVFDKWVEMIGVEIRGVTEDSYNLLFFADIMHDGTVSTHKDLPAQLLHKGKDPVFVMKGKTYELDSTTGYTRFWTMYHKPPKEEYRNYLLERRDSLIPTDEREFTGAFYTPLRVVDKAYDVLASVLGKNWQKSYSVWDMCCGVGNLETKHSNHRNLFMSTLNQSDIDIMVATNTCVQAHRFQYDYLNDDIAADGSIDYSLTGKLPADLLKMLKGNGKKLVLINPPYAEGMNAGVDVATTAIGATMGDVGYASRELFTQFVTRISMEMPGAIIGMFSKLKYVNSPNFEKFRQAWPAKYLGGFVVPSKAFDGLKGEFPIGFLVWDTSKKAHKGEQMVDVDAEVLDIKANRIGQKTFYNVPGSMLLNKWIVRSKPNGVDAVPLSNALSATTRTIDVRGTKWADGAIGGMICNGSDIQHAGDTALFSSGYCSAGGFLVTKTNLRKAAMVFTARRIIRKTWLNDRDQFLIPSQPIPDRFASDSLIWMLFSNSNLTAGADGLQWNGKTWSLVNHFIPFTETEVGSPKRFESDFMSNYLATHSLSKETAVLKAGRVIWKHFFDMTDDRKTRDAFKLNRPDVGWYQVRSALAAREVAGAGNPVSWTAFGTAYGLLTDKLRPQIYDLGFLKL
ncbi:hypothetical protein [Aureimonas glaciei]|uniref:Uncharacterized protein n=1 Tax=Aureimonas glaciei TaxID=1776957 RepID=A0A917DEK9_9HYPH|nr:hypothetical protein [Aureimonas glaciei]GGD31500.1 hypothetical protein GCM10011335_38160 [Aureimonas glaciei]